MQLSIITINYNNAEGLQKTINSILSQTFKDWEWIIIDGDSNDGSKLLLDKYHKSFSFCCSEKDNGIWDALNKGITRATGKYLSFMNSGDTYANSNTLLQVFNQQLYGDIIYGNTINIYKDKEQIIKHPSDITLSFLCNNTINHQSTFISNELQKEFYYDGKYKYAADRKFWLQAVLKSAVFQYINLEIARYDYNGISSNNINSIFQEHTNIINEIVPTSIIKDINQLNKYNKIKNNYPILCEIYNYINHRGLHSLLRLILRIYKR